MKVTTKFKDPMPGLLVGPEFTHVGKVLAENKATVVVSFPDLPGKPVKTLKKKRCQPMFGAKFTQ